MMVIPVLALIISAGLETHWHFDGRITGGQAAWNVFLVILSIIIITFFLARGARRKRGTGKMRAGK